MSFITDLTDIIAEYFKFLIGFFIGMFVLIGLLVPIGNYIPPFNDYFPFLKGISIVQWAQQYTLTIVYGIIISSTIFIVWKYKNS